MKKTAFQFMCIDMNWLVKLALVFRSKSMTKLTNGIIFYHIWKKSSSINEFKKECWDDFIAAEKIKIVGKIRMSQNKMLYFSNNSSLVKLVKPLQTMVKFHQQNKMYDYLLSHLYVCLFVCITGKWVWSVLLVFTCFAFIESE